MTAAASHDEDDSTFRSTWKSQRLLLRSVWKNMFRVSTGQRGQSQVTGELKWRSVISD